MRELGVRRWDGIELGEPVPEVHDAPAMTEEEILAAKIAEVRERLRIGYAATGFVPSPDQLEKLARRELGIS